MIGPANITADAKKNLIQHSCLKAIVYISKWAVLSNELKLKLNTTFAGMPLLVVRVDTLPKNAPIELEMIANANKNQY